MRRDTVLCVDELVALLGLGQLHLHAVDTVDAVYEQDQDEDKRNLIFSEHVCVHMRV